MSVFSVYRWTALLVVFRCTVVKVKWDEIKEHLIINNLVKMCCSNMETSLSEVPVHLLNPPHDCTKKRIFLSKSNPIFFFIIYLIWATWWLLIQLCKCHNVSHRLCWNTPEARIYFLYFPFPMFSLLLCHVFVNIRNQDTRERWKLESKGKMNEDKWDETSVCLHAKSYSGAETFKPRLCLFLCWNKTQFKRHIFNSTQILNSLLSVFPIHLKYHTNYCLFVTNWDAEDFWASILFSVATTLNYN